MVEIELNYILHKDVFTRHGTRNSVGLFRHSNNVGLDN